MLSKTAALSGMVSSQKAAKVDDRIAEVGSGKLHHIYSSTLMMRAAFWDALGEPVRGAAACAAGGRSCQCRGRVEWTGCTPGWGRLEGDRHRIQTPHLLRCWRRAPGLHLTPHAAVAAGAGPDRHGAVAGGPRKADRAAGLHRQRQRAGDHAGHAQVGQPQPPPPSCTPHPRCFAGPRRKALA
jgi:hypothetical protein